MKKKVGKKGRTTREGRRKKQYEGRKKLIAIPIMALKEQERRGEGTEEEGRGQGKRRQPLLAFSHLY